MKLPAVSHDKAMHLVYGCAAAAAAVLLATWSVLAALLPPALHPWHLAQLALVLWLLL